MFWLQIKFDLTRILRVYPECLKISPKFVGYPQFGPSVIMRLPTAYVPGRRVDFAVITQFSFYRAVSNADAV